MQSSSSTIQLLKPGHRCTLPDPSSEVTTLCHIQNYFPITTTMSQNKKLNADLEDRKGRQGRARVLENDAQIMGSGLLAKSGAVSKGRNNGSQS